MLGAILGCVLCGCSGSGSAQTVPSLRASSSADPTPTSSVQPAANASPRVATTTPPPSRTPPVRRGPARDGDLDGDGKVDTVSVTGAGDPTTWRVTVALSGGGSSSTLVQADSKPTVSGMPDADSDGRAELFLHTHAGASAEFLTPLRLINRTLTVVQSGGAPAQLGYGGTVTHGNGFACRDVVPANPGRELVLYDGQSVDGRTWEGNQRVYAWSGATLVRLTSKHESFAYSGLDDPRVAPYYSVSCGSVRI